MVSLCLYNGTVFTGFAAMGDCAVLVSDDGFIEDCFSGKRLLQKNLPETVRKIDCGGAFIAPGFIDTHIHGFAGFGTERGDAGDVLEMSKALVRYGVTAFNPTLYPAPREAFLKNVHGISRAPGNEQGARIMGLHLEGPFLSPQMCGVQKPETLSAVDVHYMEEIWDAADGRIVNMTLAPELRGSRELCLSCIKKGIVLQAGHTNAKYENMVEGMQAGILHSTHLFNAMSGLNHHNPNAAGAILIHREVGAEIIADGFHVHPDLVKLLARDKPIEKIVLVTDGLTPNEAPLLCDNEVKPPLFANGEEVLLQNGVFCRKSDGVIAGSALTMIRGVKNLVSFGFSVEDAVKTASTNPANIMKYTNLGTIIPGKAADIVVFDKDFNIKYTIVGGEIKYAAFNKE
jgi:N-acetylglucosamine-6-phosphate deacetylase